jgi:formiminotetrahydrofolate cyclodeaminase
MKLQDLNLKEFLAKTCGSDPVPGGGSISALCGSLSAALAEMVTGLTIGRKKYVDVESEMKEIAPRMAAAQSRFLQFIDDDADAYDMVFKAFKMPKESDAEKSARSEAIQVSTLHAAEVPLEVARTAVGIMDDIRLVADKGNQNAITDSCVAMMCARTATFGAILNVRINLSSLKDEEVVKRLSAECDKLQAEASQKESSLLNSIKL